MTLDTLFHFLGICVVASPAFLFGLFGGTSLMAKSLSESWTSRLTQVSVLLGLSASLAILILMLATGIRHVGK